MNRQAVTDPEDPRVADYVGLTDPELRRRTEADAGFFIVEGVLAIERVLDLGTWPIRSLLVTESAAERLVERGLDGVAAPVYVAPATVLRRVVGFDLHRGAVASVARRPPWPLDVGELLDQHSSARRVALLEGVNDHENLGALFRNAAAFEVDAVVLDRTCADPLYRRSVRVSMGHVLAVPFTVVGSAADILHVGPLDRFTSIALTPDPSATPIDELLPSGAPIAFLLGAEGPGLSDDALDVADHRVRIPLASGVDSLNVATAAAIAFYLSHPSKDAPSATSNP